MRHHYGRENLNRLARETKIGPGTAARIKGMNQDANLKTVDKIAWFFKLQSWQLLLPGLDPTNVPVFAMTEHERSLYRKLKRVQEALQEQ